MGASAETPVLAERYHLEEAVASGATGVVWRAWDHALDRTVAVKLLRSELEGDTTTVQRLRREATAAASLTHPNAVIVFDLGEDDGRVHLVMEWVDGPSLEDLLAAGPLPATMVATIGHDIARALAAAHARGLVHRDVKPSNILVTREGVPKIADFGIATALGPQQARLTTAGTVVGTARYLSPEQLTTGAVDARSDVYALGLVLHRALTGREPFGEGTATEIAGRRLVDELAPPSAILSDVPLALDEAIAYATRRAPEERFGDATALADALATLVPRDARTRLAMLVRSDRGALDAGVITPTAPPASRDSTRQLPADADAAAATTPIQTDPDSTDERPAVDVAGALPAGTPQPPPRLPRWLMATAALLVGAALVALAVDGDADRTNDEGGNRDLDGSALVVVRDAGDLDPLGDGEEHADDVPLAFDGDPSTAWRTETYQQPDLGGRKEGVGVWFDLGEPKALSGITMNLPIAGVDFQVYVSDAPFEGRDPSDHGTAVGPPQQAAGGDVVRIDVDGAQGRYVAVWISRVTEGRAEIAEIAFVGA